MRSEKKARVLETATSVFLRYGYRRTTMGDLATAAGISRPALYLLFCNKERVFEATLRQLAANLLEEIRAGIAGPRGPAEKLWLAFELWAVRPFALMLGSPDAKDLVSCGYEFAQEAMEQSQADFEALLRTVLESIPDARSTPSPSLAQIAHLLAASVHGFKGTTRSVAELEEMIDALLTLTITSLNPAGLKT